MEFKPREAAVKNLLKLKSGEYAQGVFRGDPFTFRQHWTNNRSSRCPGEGCPTCKEGKPSSFRFRINFVTKENSAYVAKVFEQGGKTYDALGALHADYNLEKTIVKISRNGNGQDTLYHITPMPKHEVPADIEKKIQDVQLNDLSSSQNVSEAPESDEDIPF